MAQVGSQKRKRKKRSMFKKFTFIKSSGFKDFE
jgi:hypothetical protein